MRKKYYDDAKENAAFERCVDVVTALILKYGPAIKRKWILRDWIKNIQADIFWRSLACKRYQRYFDCMKAIVKNDTTLHNRIDERNTDIYNIDKTRMT